MTFAPIIIPTLNRYSHLKNCVTSLANNKFAEDTELYIGLDFPPSEEYEEGYRKVKEYVYAIEGFKKVHIIERSKNMGAIENIKDIVKQVIAKHDAFIFSEDDNTFAPCFLEYANKGLEKFKDDKTVHAILGYSYPIQYEQSDTNVIKMQRYCSDWGFAIWKDRYERIRDTITQKYFDELFFDAKKTKLLRQKSKKNYIYAFGLCSPEKSSFNINPIKANIRPMDYTSSIFQCLNNMFSIMPKENFVINNGWDNSGIHKADPRLVDLFKNQKLSERKNFDTFTFDEEESRKANITIDKSPIGWFDKKTYKKIRIKELLYRCRLIELYHKFFSK